MNSSEPSVNSQMVTIEFNEDLFNAEGISNIILSSNCSHESQHQYQSFVMIPIPHINFATGRCVFGIQLINRDSEMIGYPVLFYYGKYFLCNIR